MKNFKSIGTYGGSLSGWLFNDLLSALVVHSEGKVGELLAEGSVVVAVGAMKRFLSFLIDHGISREVLILFNLGGDWFD